MRKQSQENKGKTNIAMLSNEKSSLLKNEQISSSYSSSDKQSITPKQHSLNTKTQCVVDYGDNNDGFASDDNDTKQLTVSVQSTGSVRSRVASSGGLDTGEKGTSNMATMVHIFKGNVGTGILSLPSAIKHAGVVAGPIGLLIIAFIAVHCMHLLVRCSHYFCRKTGKEAMAYGDVAEECSRKLLKNKAYLSRRVVNFFLVLTQLGFCAVYLVFVSSTIVEVAEWEGKVDKRLVIIILAVPVIFVSWIRSLEKLAYLSVGANILCVGGLVVVYQYLIRNLQDPTTLPSFAGAQNLPMFFAMALFSFEGIGVVLPLENEMRNPEDFGWVLNLSMGVISFMFISMGLLGYVAFGDKIQGSVSLNLPDNYLYNGVKLCYAMAMLLSYFLQFYVPMQILLPPLLTKWKKKNGSCFEYSFRTVLVLLTAAIAASIPLLDDFIALIGAVASAGLAVIFPPLIHIMTFWRKGLRPVAFLKDLFIILVGVTGFLLGSFTAVKTIVADFQNRNPHDILTNHTTNGTSVFHSFQTHPLV